jgi:tetratricopeptide (TPR) repeat protein
LTTVTNISDKWVLIIDDMESMRSHLNMSLSSSGFARRHVVSNIKEALEHLSTAHYHIILCDYNLGEGTDGQQFLEYLRTNDLISRSTIFIIITAEQAYTRVVAASECAPDDYLLKPFTAGELNARLERLLARQTYFKEIDQAASDKDWERMVVECDRLLACHDKYYFDLCKIKGSALMRDDKVQQAVDLYRETLAMRPLGWAKLGLARALARLDQNVEAQQLVREIIEETPLYMAAYDFLGKLLAEADDKNGALEILQKARELSPGTMSRIREYCSLAVHTGQMELAENVMRDTLHRHKYSPVRQANDYVILSKALIEQGKTKEALTVVNEGKKSFHDVHSTVVLTVTESTAHHAAGDEAMANKAMERFLSQTEIGSFSVDEELDMAAACFSLGREEDALHLMQHAVQNNPDDEGIKEKILAASIAGGKSEAEAREMIAASVNEVVELNNQGVNTAQAGHLGDAIEMLCNAVKRLPNNVQILSNTALMLAVCLLKEGNDAKKLAQCQTYRDLLFKKAPDHPKLEQIDAILKKLKSGSSLH